MSCLCLCILFHCRDKVVTAQYSTVFQVHIPFLVTQRKRNEVSSEEMTTYVIKIKDDYQLIESVRIVNDIVRSISFRWVRGER